LRANIVKTLAWWNRLVSAAFRKKQSHTPWAVHSAESGPEKLQKRWRRYIR